MKILHKLSIFILAVGLFAACGDPDVAPVPTFDGVANTTIAELLAMHEITSTNSYDSIPAGTIISGIVTTSDEHGNCYKYINIEDGTGGIQIKIANTALYNKFKVGQRVFVKCDGLVIGDYFKLPQLGYWANDAMQAIPSGKINRYIFCDGIPGDFEPTITMTTIPYADAIPVSWYNRLVKIENCSFVEGGQATYSLPNASTSHDIKLADGSVITMRTSNYADFINETLPEGTGTVVGILTRYNNYVQLVIRDLNDVQGFVPPAHTENIFTVNYANAFNEGWTKVTSGSEWSTLTNSSFNGFFVNANTETDSWLISPTVNISNVASPRLSFNQRCPAGGDNESMKLYYTTNYTGDVNSTSWTEVPMSSLSTSTSSFVYEIPETEQSSNFRFAYRYHGNNSSWYISNIAVSALVTK